MIPFGHETVTLVKRRESTVNGRTAVTYETATLFGCSWRRSVRNIREDNAIVARDGITCRIPAGQEKPMAGDLLILGGEDVTVNSGADYQALIERYRDSDGAFVAESVADNARPGMPLPHYAARGG